MTIQDFLKKAKYQVSAKQIDEGEGCIAEFPRNGTIFKISYHIIRPNTIKISYNKNNKNIEEDLHLSEHLMRMFIISHILNESKNIKYNTKLIQYLDQDGKEIKVNELLNKPEDPKEQEKEDILSELIYQHYTDTQNNYTDLAEDCGLKYSFSILKGISNVS